MSGSISQTIRRSLLFCPACNARLVRGTQHMQCPRCLMRTGPVGSKADARRRAGVPQNLHETVDHATYLDASYAEDSDACSTGGEPNPSDWSEKLVGQKLGGYRLEALLGEGAMGAVFLARHLDLGRRSAVKILSPGRRGGDTGYVRRFRAEARSSSALIHPNIVTTHAVGQDGDHDFIEMEFVAGRSLQHHIDQNPFRPDEAARVITEIAAGLAAAHREGLIHRDLKPDNILLSHARTAKIGDFGLAKPLSASVPGDISYLAGTPHYMAPELFLGQSPGPTADVYSLGVCLFTMLTGHVPYRAETFDELVSAVRTQPLPSLREECGEVSLEMAECVAMLTERSPRNRPADGIAALALIRSLVGHMRDLNEIVMQAVGDDPCVEVRRNGGRTYLIVSLPGGRRQSVLVDESQDPLDERLVRLSSTCGPADPEHFERALRMNSRIAHGAIAVRRIDGRDRFVMVDSYPASTLDAEAVRRSAWEVAVYADELERELTGGDEH